MKPVLHYDPEKQIVYADQFKDLSVSIILQAMVEGVQLAREHNCHRFFIDISSIRISLSALDVIHAVEGFEEAGLKRGDKVACLISSYYEAETRLWYTVTFNRFWHMLRFFLDATEAESWLLAE